MFNKEKFHNALALSLGYERLVKDNRITIEVEESDEPWVMLKFQGSPEVIRFKASEITDSVVSQAKPEIRRVMEAVHQAYKEGCNSRF